VTSRHRNRAGIAVRTTEDERDAVNAALAEHGWNLSDFLLASIRAVTASPGELLALLARHRPEPRPRGRPPKQPE